MDRIDAVHLDVDEGGLTLFLEGDFVDTCDDYLNRVATAGNRGDHLIALRVDRQILESLKSLAVKYLAGYHGL